MRLRRALDPGPQLAPRLVSVRDLAHWLVTMTGLAEPVAEEYVAAQCATRPGWRDQPSVTEADAELIIAERLAVVELAAEREQQRDLRQPGDERIIPVPGAVILGMESPGHSMRRATVSGHGERMGPG